MLSKPNVERTRELASYECFCLEETTNKGEALSLSRFRFSIIYRSGENFDWLQCGLRSSSSILWLWRWVLSPPDRGRSGGHQSYLHRVFRLKEEGRQFASAEIERVVLESGILLRSIARFCCMLCSQKKEQTCEGRSGLVGPESHGRGGLSEIIYYRIL